MFTEVYKEHTDALIEEFYTQFMAKTQKYKDYTLAKCKEEFGIMTCVL